MASMARQSAPKMSLSNAQTGLQSLWNDPGSSDVTIKFADQEIKAHKVLLISNSDYFARMFDKKRGFSESSQQTIVLKDDDPVALTVILRWMYGFAIEISADFRDSLVYIVSIITVADKYALPSGLLSELTRGLEEESDEAWPSQLAAVVLYIYDHDVPIFVREHVQEHHYFKAKHLLLSRSYCARLGTDADFADEVFDGCSDIWFWSRYNSAVEKAFLNLMNCRDAEWIFKLLLARVQYCVHINAKKFGWFHEQLSTETGRLRYKNNKRQCMRTLFCHLANTKTETGLDLIG